MSSPIAPVFPSVPHITEKTIPAPSMPATPPSTQLVSFRDVLTQLDKTHQNLLVNPLQSSSKTGSITDSKTLIGYQIQVSKYSLQLELCSRIVDGLTSTAKKLQSGQ